MAEANPARVVIAARVPEAVKSSLKQLAKAKHQSPSEYMADVLTKHVPARILAWNSARGGRND